LTRAQNGLSTIHFYIILKLNSDGLSASDGLSTIHFYIILKRTVKDKRI